MTRSRDPSGRGGRRVRRLTAVERRQTAGMLVGILVGVTLTAAGVVMTIASGGQRSFGSVLVALGSIAVVTTAFATIRKAAPGRRRRAGLIVVVVVWAISALSIIAYAIGR
jgi:hypothetical protein